MARIAVAEQQDAGAALGNAHGLFLGARTDQQRRDGLAAALALSRFSEHPLVKLWVGGGNALIDLLPSVADPMNSLFSFRRWNTIAPAWEEVLHAREIRFERRRRDADVRHDVAGAC